MNVKICLVLLVICVTMVTARSLHANDIKRILSKQRLFKKDNSGSAVNGNDSRYDIVAENRKALDRIDRLEHMLKDLAWLDETYDWVLAESEVAYVHSMIYLVDSLKTDERRYLVPTEQPMTEQPTTEQSMTESPTTEQPTTEPPTADQPTTESPTTEPPTTTENLEARLLSNLLKRWSSKSKYINRI